MQNNGGVSFIVQAVLSICTLILLLLHEVALHEEHDVDDKAIQQSSVKYDVLSVSLNIPQLAVRYAEDAVGSQQRQTIGRDDSRPLEFVPLYAGLVTP